MQECLTLRSSLVSKTLTDTCSANTAAAGYTLLRLSGYDKELVAAGAVLPFLELELWASLGLRQVDSLKSQLPTLTVKYTYCEFTIALTSENFWADSCQDGV